MTDIAESSLLHDRPHASGLERITAGLLMLVILTLGWIVLRAYEAPLTAPLAEPYAKDLPQPTKGANAVPPAVSRLSVASVESEVVLVIGLLSAALALVIVLALLHTRDSRPGPAAPAHSGH